MLKINTPPQQKMNFKIEKRFQKKSFYFWHDNPSSKTAPKGNFFSSHIFFSVATVVCIRLFAAFPPPLGREDQAAGHPVHVETQKIKQRSIKFQNAREDQEAKRQVPLEMQEWVK